MGSFAQSNSTLLKWVPCRTTHPGSASKLMNAESKRSARSIPSIRKAGCALLRNGGRWQRTLSKGKGKYVLIDLADTYNGGPGIGGRLEAS